MYLDQRFPELLLESSEIDDDDLIDLVTFHKSIKNSVPTRWWSLYSSLLSILNQVILINDALKELNKLEFVLSNDEISILRELVKNLEILKIVTDYLSKHLILKSD